MVWDKYTLWSIKRSGFAIFSALSNGDVQMHIVKTCEQLNGFSHGSSVRYIYVQFELDGPLCHLELSSISVVVCLSKVEFFEVYYFLGYGTIVFDMSYSWRWGHMYTQYSQIPCKFLKKNVTSPFKATKYVNYLTTYENEILSGGFEINMKDVKRRGVDGRGFKIPLEFVRHRKRN